MKDTNAKTFNNSHILETDYCLTEFIKGNTVGVANSLFYLIYWNRRVVYLKINWVSSQPISFIHQFKHKFVNLVWLSNAIQRLTRASFVLGLKNISIQFMTLPSTNLKFMYTVMGKTLISKHVYRGLSIKFLTRSCDVSLGQIPQSLKPKYIKPIKTCTSM